MTRRPTLARLGWLLCCAVSTCRAADAPAGPQARPPVRPNIVLIFADDLGWRDVGSNGDGFIETPNIDRLRAQGMAFTSAYAGAANCAPSRACLLSGQYTPRHGVYAVGDTDRGPKDRFRLAPMPNAHGLRPDVVTVAESLRGLGYATGHFGKWHLGSDAKGMGPQAQGFDVSPPELVPARDGGGEDDEEEETPKPRPEAAKKARAAQKSTTDDPKKAASITRAACGFIEDSARAGRPFFAYLAHHAIHTQLQAKEETLARFRAKAAAAQGPHVSALYAACTYDLDASVGVLLKRIDDLGLAQNTLVIFTSDNGGTPASINEPLRGAKGAYYEAGIREPFFARWPGRVAPGSTCDVPIINQDLYPTFVAAAGGTPAPALDGASLLPLLDGKAEVDRSSIFWHFPGYLDKPVPRGRDPLFRTRPVSVIRRGEWKLFLYHEEWLLDGGRAALGSNRAVELYRVGRDVGEREDLAQVEVARRDELLDELLGWFGATGAPLAGRK